MSETKKVYMAIAAVTETLSHAGIAKDRKNDHQGYQFRGIDDVYNALAPVLAKHKLCVLPAVLEREVVERTGSKGNALFYVTVKVDFAFVSAEDGSEHHVVTYGEAMDSGDKATNKAMSAAYKYAAMQAFCIPTEGDNDADSQTHEVKAQGMGAGPKISPTNGDMSFDKLPIDLQNHLLDIADRVSRLMKKGDTEGAWEELISHDKDLDEHGKVMLWSRLDSKERSALKKFADLRKEAEKKAA